MGFAANSGPMKIQCGLIVPGDLTHEDVHAERRAALDMTHRQSPGSTLRLTLGADKGYAVAGFVTDLRKACVTPHVAQKSCHSATHGRTTRRARYARSINRRNRIEVAFGWAKTVGHMTRTVYLSVERLRSGLSPKMAVNNLARRPKLQAASRRTCSPGAHAASPQGPDTPCIQFIGRETDPEHRLFQWPDK